MALPNEEQTFLNQPIYNIESKTGDIELGLGEETENKEKEPIRASAFTPVQALVYMMLVLLKIN